MSFAPTAAEQRLTFNERPMKTSLIRYVSASAYNGATSTETVLGLGVDSGRVLNWFGKRIFSMTVDFVIHARLSAISTFITQRNSVTELRKKDVNRLQGVCAVLLELCRPEYQLKIRRRSLGLIFAILQSIDKQTTLILESDFTDVLASCQLDQSGDCIVFQVVAQITRIVDAFRRLPCHCTVCLRSLNFELRHNCNITEHQPVV